MKTVLVLLFFFGGIAQTLSQSFRVESSTISFFSQAPLEDIKAETDQSVGVFNADTGDMAFVIMIADFQFPRSLMQEHFNENFMESSKFPRATFEGKLGDFTRENGVQQTVNVSGIMTIHGVANQMKIPGRIRFDGKKIQMDAVFPIELADHEIEIPTLLFKKIAETVEVTVHMILKTD